MTFMRKLLDKLNLSNIEANKVSQITPKYIAGMDWTQDSDKSIVDAKGAYDLTRFSKHESDTIFHVLNTVSRKYPQEYQSLGLANESSAIKYKARYVLFEIVILKYGQSDNPMDKFAVAVAYQSKGAHYRDMAIQYFEESIDSLSPAFLQQFVYLMPLGVFNSFSKLYEQAHEYDKAIYYTREAEKYCSTKNSYYDNHVKELLEKKSKDIKPRQMKMSDKQRQFEIDVTNAAKYFIEHDSAPLGLLEIPREKEMPQTVKSTKPKRVKREMTNYDIERFAVECNALLAKEDKAERYNNQ